MNRYLLIAFAEYPVQIERVPESIHSTPPLYLRSIFIINTRNLDVDINNALLSY